MYHSILINDKHTYRDYHLIPTSRPVVNPPQAKTNYADVNGINGSLDLSTALTGFMTFQDRSGSWEFLVKKRVRPWEVDYTKLMNDLHGKYFDRIRLEDEPYYYYKGRLFVSAWKSQKDASYVTINYTLEPYKYEIQNSLEDWLWDPFSFETGVIRNYKNLVVSGTLALEVPGSARPYIPTITVSAAMTVTFNGTTYNLASGSNTIPEIVISQAGTTLTFSGSGTVSVLYQGAWL